LNPRYSSTTHRTVTNDAGEYGEEGGPLSA